ncbi:hypothetical protein [Flavobacterium hercynium]|nr:hypothetical protein [Flavobacterium hercynium]
MNILYLDEGIIKNDEFLQTKKEMRLQYNIDRSSGTLVAIVLISTD